MQQVTFHFLLLAAAGVLAIREQMTNDKATQIRNQPTIFFQNGISENLQKITQSSEKLKELVNNLQKNLNNSQIPSCALTETQALQNIVDELSDFSSFLDSSESLVTGNWHASLPMFLQMRSFASLSSVVSGVIIYHTQTLHKYCQTKSEESDLQATLQKRYSELEKIYDDVARSTEKNILRLLSQRKALFKKRDVRNLQISFKPTDIGGYALRGSEQSVMTRFRRERATTRAGLRRKLHELCRGLDLEMCQDSLDDHYPLKNGAVLEKTLFPTFDTEEITFKLKQAENCVDRFKEYKRCQAMKNIMPTKICLFPVCIL